MVTKQDDLKGLLKTAEDRIIELGQENEGLSNAYYELMEAQKAEMDQMLKLSEQIWQLEDALSKVAFEKDAVLETLAHLKQHFDVMKKQAQMTLEAAASNASRLELAARVYEMASLTEAGDLDQRIAAYNAALANRK